jgi:hypothetical protein
MSVFLRFRGPIDALSFEGWFAVVTLRQSGAIERAVDTRGADGDDGLVEDHERDPSIAFEGILGAEVEDRLLLPIFEPPVAGDQRFVLVGPPVAAAPDVELAGGDAQPGDEASDGDLGARRPVGDEFDNVVAEVVGNPGLG